MVLKICFRLIFSSLIIFFSCDKNTTENIETYSVSGTVYSNNSPLPNATVSIDSKASFSTKTGNNGDFTINNIPKGAHNLEVNKTFNDGSFIENNSNITVDSDLLLNSLILPKAVTLNPPAKITDESMTLSWTSTDVNDFREYKLYRHITSGLDETTGTLVHVSTAINDTIFTDANLDPLSVYFYRVYIMNEFGRLGGSNIVSDTTENKNYIWNGNFEKQENLYNWWTGYSYGAANYTDSIKVEGNYALSMIADSARPSNPYLLANLSKYDFPELLPNRYYKISFWVKTEGAASTYGGDFWGTRTEKAGLLAYNHFGVLGIPENTDWTYIENIFYISDQNINDFSIEVRSCSENAWFDDIRLEIVGQ